MASLDPPIWDPLGTGEPLPLQETFYPLGFPLRVETNRAETFVAARAAFPWPAAAFSTPPLVLRVLAGGERPGAPAPPRVRARGALFAAVADAHQFAIADVERGEAYCELPANVVEQPEFLSFYYLELLAYWLLCDRWLTPLHASCVARRGRGLLLSAPPGTGKSCLAYACWRAGLDFVTDDAGYVPRSARTPLLLGRPHSLRLRPEAAALFPELKGRPLTRLGAGEAVMELRPLESPAPDAGRCELAAVVFLERSASSQQPRLDMLAPGEVLERLRRELPRARQPSHTNNLRVLKRLSSLPAFRLCYREAAQAVPELASLLGRAAGTARAGHRAKVEEKDPH